MSQPEFRPRSKRRGSSTRRFTTLLVLAVVLFAGMGSAYVYRSAIIGSIEGLFSSDFQGDGHGDAQIVIAEGDSGETVARSLVSAGVVKDFKTIYKQILKLNPMFYPGTYALHKQMNSLSALELLQNPDSRVYLQVTVREGLRLSQVIKVLSEKLDIPKTDFETSLKDHAAIGVPSNEVSAEGWLFPATYKFDPEASASTVLSAMVERTKQELVNQNVAEKKWHEVLTLASIIQKEARLTADFYKVSRVFLNRLDQGMLLQSDATVSYGSGGTTVTTTDAERASKNGYNTYVHLGLPIGPISAPGALAIEAALNPAKGKWLYFCAINLKTGETVFSETMAQHEVAVQQFRAWIRQNPGWNG